MQFLLSGIVERKIFKISANCSLSAATVVEMLCDKNVRFSGGFSRQKIKIKTRFFRRYFLNRMVCTFTFGYFLCWKILLLFIIVVALLDFRLYFIFVWNFVVVYNHHSEIWGRNAKTRASPIRSRVGMTKQQRYDSYVPTFLYFSNPFYIHKTKIHNI